MVSLRDLPWLLLVWLSVRRSVGGLELCVSESNVGAEDVLAKATAALELIERYDPPLRTQISDHVRRLLFTETSGSGYLAGIATCRFAIGYARRVPPLELAMTIVHEATHARLAGLGTRYRGAEREAIERTCVEAEISFAAKVPGSGDAIAKSRRLLETRWWDAQQMGTSALTEFRKRGVPEWLAKRLARRTGR